MKIRIIVALFLSFGMVGQAIDTPIEVIKRVRAKYPNLPNNRPVTNQALREIARELHAGILIKKSGNNCLGYACDQICFKTGMGSDVFIDWENKATPTWNPHPRYDPEDARLENIKVSQRLTEISGQLKQWDESLAKCLKEKNEIEQKLAGVRCRGMWGLPCTVIK